MFDLDNVCCLCLKKSNETFHYTSSPSSEKSYYEKLRSLPQLVFNDAFDNYKLCLECCNTINTIYEFNKTCLQNLNTYIQYLTVEQKNHHNSQQISKNNEASKIIGQNSSQMTQNNANDDNTEFGNQDSTFNENSSGSRKKSFIEQYSDNDSSQSTKRRKCDLDPETDNKQAEEEHEDPDEEQDDSEEMEEETHIENVDFVHICATQIKVEKEDTNILEYTDNQLDLDFVPSEDDIEFRTPEKLDINLPEKSKHRYEQAYFTFTKWCFKKGIDINSLRETEILEYFYESSKKSKCSTLWIIYSMLKATLSQMHNIDIVQFKELTKYLKEINVGYKANKSSALTREQVDTFLREAPGMDYLPLKVALIIGVSGDCKCDELLKMKIEDFRFLEDVIIVNVSGTRSFVITNLEWIKIVTFYKNLRRGVENSRFFLQIRNGKMTKQPFGHNAIGNFPKRIASYLGLTNSGKYTGYCFRRTAALLADKKKNTAAYTETPTAYL